MWLCEYCDAENSTKNDTCTSCGKTGNILEIDKIKKQEEIDELRDKQNLKA